MPLIQILLTAVSLAAVGGGTLGVDRVMDDLCRIPPAVAEAEAPECEASDEDDEAESRLAY